MAVVDVVQELRPSSVVRRSRHALPRSRGAALESGRRSLALDRSRGSTLLDNLVKSNREPVDSLGDHEGSTLTRPTVGIRVPPLRPLFSAFSWLGVLAALCTLAAPAQAGVQRFAVIIGNNQGQAPDATLRYAEADADKVAR